MQNKVATIMAMLQARSYEADYIHLKLRNRGPILCMLYNGFKIEEIWFEQGPFDFRAYVLNYFTILPFYMLQRKIISMI